MRKLTKLLILFLMVLCIQPALAQEEEKGGNWDLGMDFMSRYTWRGIDYGAAPSLQPFLSYTNGGFEIGYWGAYSTNFAGFQETDIYMSYTFMNEMLSVGVTDYYYPDITAFDQGYLDFNNETTGHTEEFSLTFNGTEDMPLSVGVYTCVYGADKIFSDSVLNNSNSSYDYNTKASYSTYVELGYSLEVKDVTLDLFAGYLLNGVNMEDAILPGGEGFYLDGSGLINLGVTASKKIAITEKWSLPVSSSLILNPKRERVFFVFGFSF